MNNLIGEPRLICAAIDRPRWMWAEIESSRHSKWAPATRGGTTIENGRYSGGCWSNSRMDM